MDKVCFILDLDLYLCAQCVWSTSKVSWVSTPDQVTLVHHLEKYVNTNIIKIWLKFHAFGYVMLN